MDDRLSEAKRILGKDRKFADVTIREEGGELHLLRGDDHFARLIPTWKEGVWRMEHFRNLEEWERIDFTGNLEECLEFFSDNPHYLFWEG